MPSYGYAGPTTAAEWTKMQTGLGIDYSCAGLPDCKVTANTSGVQVAAGIISGWGVVDFLTAPVVVNLSAPGSGTAWWMIVARRNWSTPATTFVAITAGTSRPSTLPTRQTTPGGLDDQPLALVGWTAGQSQPNAVVDLRVIGMAGQQVAYDVQALQYLTIPGRQVRIGSNNWICSINPTAQALEWVNGTSGSGGLTSGSNANGTWVRYEDGLLVCTHTKSFGADANTGQSYTWNYPKDFVAAAPFVAITCDTAAPQNVSTSVTGLGISSVVIRFYRTTNSATSVSFQATGRWK